MRSRTSTTAVVYVTVAVTYSTFRSCAAFADSPVWGWRRPLSSCLAASRTDAECQMTRDALSIVDHAIQAVDPYKAVQKHLKFGENGCLTTTTSGDNKPKEYSHQDFDEIVLIAFGKASSAMAKSCVDRLRESTASPWSRVPLRGVVLVKDDHATKAELTTLSEANIRVMEASHPVPDERSALGAQSILELLEDTETSTTERSLVLCCISGGGSALFCGPRLPLTLDDLRRTNQALLASGMTIQQMNVVRKRLETGKGGRLAAAAHPGTVLTLVLSDILGDPLDLIASGPTVPDPSTFDDAWQLIQNHDASLREQIPESVLELLQDGLEGRVDDTPNQDHPVFEKTETVLVGNNELAVLAAAEQARAKGYHPVVLGTRIEGEARHVAGVYTAMAQHLASAGRHAAATLPAALIGGGETTVTLTPGSGKGGRNQELALAAGLQLHQFGLRNVVLASAGTDGTDGPTDAAGAVVDGGTVERLQGSAEQALQRHDAYNYLDQQEEDGHSPLIKTGPTGTNVADVCVTLIQ